MSLNLPTETLEPKSIEPRFMIIAGSKKAGKTSACLQLPKSLLIDLEDGASLFGGTYVNLLDELPKYNLTATKKVGLGGLHLLYADEINKVVNETGKSPYDYIIIDNTSVLAEIAKPLATNLYKSSLVGKNFRGSDVTMELPNGAGWNWYRKAFLSLVNPYRNLANKCLILLSHTKNSEVNQSGYGIFTITDLEIPGSSKHALLKDCDAQGVLFRSKEKTDDNRLQNVLTFKTRDDGDIMGCRIPYLANQEIVLSDFHPETFEVRTYWDRIFPSIAE